MAPRSHSLALLLLVAVAAAAAAAAPPGAAGRGGAAPAAAAAAPPRRLERREQLAPGVSFSWSVDAAAGAIEAEFEFGPAALGGAAPGYVAVGLSETGGMKGADIWALVKNATTGRWALGDYFAEGFSRPTLDTHQDLRLLSAGQAPDGAVTARLRRVLAPCDASDLQITPGAPLHVIWAWGEGSGGDLSYHGTQNRGYKMIVLAPPAEGAAAAGAKAAPAGAKAPLAAAKAAPPAAGRRLQEGGGGVHGATPGADAAAAAAAGREAAARGGKVLNLTLPPLVVPPKETTYYIQYFKLPAGRKRWVTRYAPLFNMPLVHHAVVYGCSPRVVAANLTAMEKEGNLGPFDTSRNASGHSNLCHDFWMVTAPNVKPYETPPGAGLPFGGAAPGGGPTWVSLELHYNNPEGLTTESDAGSGVWLEYTDGPLKTDVGLLTLGQLDLRVPPGRDAFSAPPAVCPGSCTSQRLQKPVTMLHQGYHMHGIGKSAVTRRFRDGAELRPLYEQRFFDYGYQSLLPVPKGSEILHPGERLEFTCTFDSLGRTNVTRMGPATDDEMCFHWIYYYPAVPNFGVCSTVGPVNASSLAACGPDIMIPAVIGAAAAGRPQAVAMLEKARAVGMVVEIPAGESPPEGAAPYAEACSAARA
ncbi:MAG: PHM/PNGase F domain-containing protein [Monoraphidium minutum]|nr:MAG: PHM/PNGase F domain-containing protein [Monoraphidium minutum]